MTVLSTLKTMRILFIHQNFPAQFKHLAPVLAAYPDNEVIALTMQKNMPEQWQGVRLISYQVARGTTLNIHPWLSDFEPKVIRGEAVFNAALTLRDAGFIPDLIIAHSGWGESLFIKEVWPEAKLAVYCEFFYHAQGADVNFDGEFSHPSLYTPCRLRLKNINNFLHFDIADAAISPTHWQASTFPEPFRHNITVIHDGIDTQAITPNPNAQLSFQTVAGEITLSRNDEIITFVSRHLEPYRGYHIFMRALPELLRQRPNARVLIVGAEENGYGVVAPKGTTWKNLFLNEVKQQLDMRRVHFLDRIDYHHFIAMLQLSRVHIYLTYPFVLSWSLLEAMSVGCSIVASDTAPLHEAITHNETGRLVNFFDSHALANEVCDLLANDAERQRLGNNARTFAQQHYDLQKVCLPQQLAWLEKVVQGERL